MSSASRAAGSQGKVRCGDVPASPQQGKGGGARTRRRQVPVRRRPGTAGQEDSQKQGAAGQEERAWPRGQAAAARTCRPRSAERQAVPSRKGGLSSASQAAGSQRKVRCGNVPTSRRGRGDASVDSRRRRSAGGGEGETGGGVPPRSRGASVTSCGRRPRSTAERGGGIPAYKSVTHNV